MTIRTFLFSVLLLLAGACSSGEPGAGGGPSMRSQARVTRERADRALALASPQLVEHEKYPWEERFVGGHPRVTQHFFRCRGRADNPVRMQELVADLPIELSDCGGAESHSLPIRDEKEAIYPILVTLLNYLQEETGGKVVVTCGHRCPKHNTYADSSVAARTSKHMIGAEVDFYVEGMERDPHEVVRLIREYFRKDPLTAGDPEFEDFLRYEKPDTNVSIQPWYNKEVFVKLFQSHEGRDFDNDHGHPYVGVMVRWDRDRDERVSYTWEAAHKGYYRW